MIHRTLTTAAIRRLALLAGALLLGSGVSAQRQENIFRGADAVASDARRNYEATKAIDGQHYRASAWMPANDSRPPYLLEINLTRYCDIDSMVIYTGIPEGERTALESTQSPGYWNMKNFIIQYWDDANWTDISETLTTENRQDKIVFRFKPAVTSFRFRLRSTDGEPIRIIEFEGYGRPNATLPSPETVSKGIATTSYPTSIEAIVQPQVWGRSMHYVGYNQGYYMPNSNISAWLEYARVNSLRVWMPLEQLVPESAVDSSTPQSVEEFDRLKEQLRRDPKGCAMIDWSRVEAAADSEFISTNSMVYSHVLDELRRLDIKALIQTSAYKQTPSWEKKWLLWQRMYALAYYSAQRGGVEMYSMQNEPNHRHAGPIPLDEWIRMMRIASDAVHCAVEDASRDGAGKLTGRFVGPVTAGTNTNWWATIAAEERVDYRGQSMDRELVDLFSTHSYNLPATGYVGKVATVNNILTSNHPQGLTKPVIFTEIGRWMNAYLIDKEETMDSPTLFTEWAGIYTKNMLEGCYGMWAFKFANTASSTYPQGIKSGHHHIWKGRRFAEDAFENLATACRVTASATDLGSKPENINDGVKTVAHGWSCTADGGKWIELALPRPTELGGMVIYTGSEGGEFTAPDRIRALTVEAECNGKWQKIGSEKSCRYAQLFFTFEKPLTATRIRITSPDQGHSVIREVKLFGAEFIGGGERSFDVGGPQRTAEVVRLFAKGFRAARPLLRVESSSDDPDFDLCTSIDSAAQTAYVWIVQRHDKIYDLTLNLAALGLRDATIVCERVSGDKYGEASLLTTDASGVLKTPIPAHSVSLLTLPLGATKHQQIAATATATLRHQGLDPKQLTVAMDSSAPQNNAVTVLSFDTSKADLASASRILLSIHGDCNAERPFRFHVYGGSTPYTKSQRTLPGINPSTSQVSEAGSRWFVAGELALTPDPQSHLLDVTELVKRHTTDYATFVLIRELREPGDDYDKGIIGRIASQRQEAPKLLILR